MNLFPDYGTSTEMTGKLRTKKSGRTVFPAVTEYRVLNTNNMMSLVEAKPITGFKHQIRCHLAFGIDCPVLGDHKFTYVDEIGRPQV